MIDDEVTTEELPAPFTLQEGLESLDKIKRLLCVYGGDEHLLPLDGIKDYLQRTIITSQKQSVISDFFGK